MLVEKITASTIIVSDCIACILTALRENGILVPGYSVCISISDA